MDVMAGRVISVCRRTRMKTLLSQVFALFAAFVGVVHPARADLPQMPAYSMQFQFRPGGASRVLKLVGKFAIEQKFACHYYPDDAGKEPKAISCGIGGDDYIFYSHEPDQDAIIVNVYDVYDDNSQADPGITMRIKVAVGKIIAAARNDPFVVKACARTKDFGVSVRCSAYGHGRHGAGVANLPE